MPKKPTTLEEIREDLAKHPNRGKVHGVDVCTNQSIELNVFIEGSLYNKLILIRGALGFSKSNIATAAMLDTLSQFRLMQKYKIKMENILVSGKCNFRGNVPVFIYRQCVGIGNRMGLQANQVAFFALKQFAFKPEMTNELEEFIKLRSQELQCSEEEVVQAIYGYSKKISREERCKKAERDLSVLNQPKMDI